MELSNHLYNWAYNPTYSLPSWPCLSPMSLQVHFRSKTQDKGIPEKEWFVGASGRIWARVFIRTPACRGKGFDESRVRSLPGM